MTIDLNTLNTLAILAGAIVTFTFFANIALKVGAKLTEYSDTLNEILYAIAEVIIASVKGNNWSYDSKTNTIVIFKKK